MKELYLVCLDGQSCWHPDSIWLTEEDANKRVDKILKDPLYEDIQPVIRKIKNRSSISISRRCAMVI